MGLACSQIRLLTLTQRKADCELNLSIDSSQKMALSREQAQLSQDYSAKLKQKSVAYYANGKYNQINYNYLMGYGCNYAPITAGTMPLKTDNSVVLCDYKGQVVMSDSYTNAITAVLGSTAMDSVGRGSTFSTDEIPAILAELIPGYSKEDFETIINNKKVAADWEGETVNTISGEATGTDVTVDSTDKTTSILQNIVDFYYPIFQAAAANGWTTEYNQDITSNEDYISDAIVSGSFQLESVEENGNYDCDTCLTYYLTNGFLSENNSAEYREEITAWYEAEKARISEKEDYLDIDIDNLSTELESINAEIQSVQSLIDDAISSVFDWGGGS